MWIIYVIQHNLSKNLYIGYTGDLKRRLLRHNAGSTRSTKRRNGRWELIYAEAYRHKDDAINREKKLKQHGTAKHKLYERISKSLLENSN